MTTTDDEERAKRNLAIIRKMLDDATLSLDQRKALEYHSAQLRYAPLKRRLVTLAIGFATVTVALFVLALTLNVFPR